MCGMVLANEQHSIAITSHGMRCHGKGGEGGGGVVVTII
jgi:hypothetical protein